MSADISSFPFAGIIDKKTFFFLEPASGVIFAVRVGKAIFVLVTFALAVGQIFDFEVGVSAHVCTGQIRFVPGGTLSSLNFGAFGLALAACVPSFTLG